MIKLGIPPKIPKKQVETRQCIRCNRTLSKEQFAFTHSVFHAGHHIPLCHDCINEYLTAHNYDWTAIDKLCQWADIPFIVREWERIADKNEPEEIWGVYSRIFQDQCYINFGWGYYNEQYRRLREVGLIEDELPLIYENKMNDLRKKWGSNYDDEELYYLEDLLQGLKTTQNVNGALQIDQAQKICKLSLVIDEQIRAGNKDVEKFLSSYDKLVKTAEFTPKNSKNAVDFDSIAEVWFWLEKKGKENLFYDGVTRDVIDEAIKNIQSYNRKLYINEGGLGEEITDRIKALELADSIYNPVEGESKYGLGDNFDEEAYDNAGYTFEDEEDDFVINEDGEVFNE